MLTAQFVEPFFCNLTAAARSPQQGATPYHPQPAVKVLEPANRRHNGDRLQPVPQISQSPQMKLFFCTFFRSLSHMSVGTDRQADK